MPRPLDRPIPRYHSALDFAAVWREFPPAPEYLDNVYVMPRDELRALQEARFLRQIDRAWKVPFYRRHWGNAGIEPGDIRSIADVERLPVFSVHDLRESIARNPPWGDLIGIDPDFDDPLPLILQTSGGTTGLPRAMLYAPRDREVMNINTARRMYIQGVRPFDRVQIALATGLSNAGFLLRESLWKYTGAIPIVTGTGSQTPSRRQIELLRAWDIDFLAALAPYVRHLGNLARDELKFDVRDLKLKGLLCWLGVDDRKPIEEQWGTDVYDNYGTNEIGTLCCDCRHKSGMHVFEDAFLAEVADPLTLETMPDGEKGVLVVTTLFKHAAPMIRFNTNDVMSFVPGACPCGSTQRRLSKVFGRADNMVKFRGVNIFPEAVGALVAEHADANGEYVCVVEPETPGGREEMIVLVEAAGAGSDRTRLREALVRRFHEALGVRLAVDVVGKGELSALTGVADVMKVQRLIDKRKS
jgi:phenylacetate-CoA ligase